MSGTVKPYPTNKDADLPWLDRLPEHWSVVRLKTIFREVDHRSGTGTEPLLSLRMGIGLVDHHELGGKPIPPSALTQYKVTRPGQIVMNRMRAASGLFGVPPKAGLVSPDYAVLQPTTDLSPDYFVALFQTPQLMGLFRSESRGLGTGDAGFMRLYTDRFGALSVPLPPLSEQDGAVRFLHHYNAMIRRYVSAKRRLIRLLEEQKSAIVRQAIARGPQPNVELKTSGIEWFPDIPTHWEVMPLKRVLSRLIDCEHKTAPAVDRSDYIVVRTSAVRHAKLRLDGTYRTTEEAFAAWTRRGLPEPGDVIFTREAPAGEACRVPEGLNVCLGQRTVLMKPNREMYDPDFLVHMIYSGPPRDRIRLASQGSTVGHFNMDDIGWMSVLVPPLDEQLAITDNIDRSTSHIDGAVEQLEQEIDLINEYRTRLTADVVTGKVDVREAVTSLPDEIEPLKESLDMWDEADYDEEADEFEPELEEAEA